VGIHLETKAHRRQRLSGSHSPEARGKKLYKLLLANAGHTANVLNVGMTRGAKLTLPIQCLLDQKFDKLTCAQICTVLIAQTVDLLQ